MFIFYLHFDRTPKINSQKIMKHLLANIFGIKRRKKNNNT